MGHEKYPKKVICVREGGRWSTYWLNAMLNATVRREGGRWSTGMLKQWPNVSWESLEGR